MHMTLEIKKKCSWFWLRGIRRVRIDKCCTGCFIADKFNEVYEKTYFKEQAFVELDVTPDERVIAYYLCGISKGMVWVDNTHIAFIPHDGENIAIENDKIRLEITNAQEIHFQDYKPNPPGDFTRRQRTCRNWIFANYIKDGMLRK